MLLLFLIISDTAVKQTTLYKTHNIKYNYICVSRDIISFKLKNIY